ncbi:hypothetical protein [Streptomyces sp. IBSBF 2950]|uniref:hypothetical protein n=1 Tax=Streptomyces sp. IBSBF 2950 TaxID=2903528 RepID=UPI002FDBC2F3
MMVATVVQSADADQRVQNEIGPRTEGATYFNPTGTFEVLQVLRGAEAREALGRSGTDWAVRVRRLSTGQETVHAMVWTNSDHVIEAKPKPVKVRRVEEIREDLAKGTVSTVDCEVLENLALVAAYGTTRAVTTR